MEKLYFCRELSEYKRLRHEKQEKMNYLLEIKLFDWWLKIVPRFADAVNITKTKK